MYCNWSKVLAQHPGWWHDYIMSNQICGKKNGQIQLRWEGLLPCCRQRQLKEYLIRQYTDLIRYRYVRIDWTCIYSFLHETHLLNVLIYIILTHSCIYFIYLFILMSVWLNSSSLPTHILMYRGGGAFVLTLLPRRGESSTYGPPKMWTICSFWGNKWTCSELLFFFQLFIV